MQIPEEITGNSRTERSVVRRAIYAEELRSRGYNYSEIGRFLNRSHGSIIRLLNRIDDWRDTKDLLYFTEKKDITF